MRFFASWWDRLRGSTSVPALVSVLVAGLFDHHFVDIHFPHVVALAWLVIGLMAVSLRLDRVGETEHVAAANQA